VALPLGAASAAFLRYLLSNARSLMKSHSAIGGKVCVGLIRTELALLSADRAVKVHAAWQDRAAFPDRNLIINNPSENLAARLTHQRRTIVRTKFSTSSWGILGFNLIMKDRF
jgi:hypothetical protein